MQSIYRQEGHRHWPGQGRAPAWRWWAVAKGASAKSRAALGVQGGIVERIA
ncbi:hypothetical protein NAV28_03080 [Pseudomonas stutzeri]|nr:hypothetical protein [Stutzerimonas degradans]